MVFSKRVRWSALCLMGAVLFAAMPARGGPPKMTGSAVLTAAGAEPSALGSATLSLYIWGPDYWGEVSYTGNVSVNCKKLSPGAVYQVALQYCALASPMGIANAKGNLTVKSSVSSGSPPNWIEVYRVEPNGIVLVLYGTISYK
jgi:hypothetical protein